MTTTTIAEPVDKGVKRLSLSSQIAIGIAAGVLVGLCSPSRWSRRS